RNCQSLMLRYAWQSGCVGCVRRLAVQVRVEGVADAVAEEVEGEHGDEDRRAGRDRHPPGVLEKVLAEGEHLPPAWGRRLHAEAEEREGRLGEDGEGHA